MYICKCVFVCVRVCVGASRQAMDNKWKCSPSTAVFNWSNRPKQARSCCPNNEGLVRPRRKRGEVSVKRHAALRLCDRHSAAVQLISQKKVPELDHQAQPLQLVITAELRFQKCKSSHLFAYFRRNPHSTPSRAKIIPNSTVFAIFKAAAAEV